MNVFWASMDRVARTAPVMEERVRMAGGSVEAWSWAAIRRESQSTRKARSPSSSERREW